MEKSILVVDDEQDVRTFLTDLLEDQGYTVRTAPDGVKAMERIREELPDLILLDLMMPEETGTNLYRKLHDKKNLRDIPVVVISGAAGRRIAVGKSVPVFDKPIDEEKLLFTVGEILG